jgi:hypothetical protein
MTTSTATNLPALADLGDDTCVAPCDCGNCAGLPGSHLGYFNDVATPVWDLITREVDVPTTTLRLVTL